MKGQLTKEQLEERLSFLLRKKRAIEELKKTRPYYKPNIDLSGLDREIDEIESQLSGLTV